MNEEELHSQFRKLKFELPHSSIKRWSRQNLLPRPTITISRGIGGGRGRASDWPDATVAQAAAIYAIRNLDYPGQKKRISPKTIATIRGFATTFLVTLEEYRDNVDDPLLADFENRFFTDVHLELPSNYVKEANGTNDVEKMPKWRRALFSKSYEALAVKWISTVEKVGLGTSLTMPITFRYYFGRTQPNRLNPEGYTQIPLRYLIATAMRSELDKVNVIAKSSELERLPRLVEDEAFLGAKIKDEGWMRVTDAEGRCSADQLVGLIRSTIGHARAEVGEA